MDIQNSSLTQLIELGYEQETVLSAFGQLVENSVNGDSRKIRIEISKSHNNISILDDGVGISLNALRTSLTSKFGGLVRGTMRLGTDALIFTKTKSFYSMAFLSRTLVGEVQTNDCVMLPLCTWSSVHGINTFSPLTASMKIILTYTSLDSVTDVKNIFEGMPKTGTLISIANLGRTSENISELDFDTDITDFRVTTRNIKDHPSNFSLRKYLQNFYLIPRTRIVLREVMVDSIPIPASLYLPVSYLHENFNLIFGWNADPRTYLYTQGLSIYQNGRLICSSLPLHGFEGETNALMIICDTSLPVNDSKEMFSHKDQETIETSLRHDLDNYLLHSRSNIKPNQSLHIEAIRKGGIKMVQCVNCLKWRIQSGKGSSCSAINLPNGKSFDCSIEESSKLFEDLSLGFTAQRKRRRIDMDEDSLKKRRLM